MDDLGGDDEELSSQSSDEDGEPSESTHTRGGGSGSHGSVAMRLPVTASSTCAQLGARGVRSLSVVAGSVSAAVPSSSLHSAGGALLARTLPVRASAIAEDDEDDEFAF